MRSAAIVAAGAMIALAVFVTNHWEVMISTGDLVHLVRLNRWNGQADICWVNPDTVKAERSLAGAKYRCGDLPTK